VLLQRFTALRDRIDDRRLEMVLSFLFSALLWGIIVFVPRLNDGGVEQFIDPVFDEKPTVESGKEGLVVQLSPYLPIFMELFVFALGFLLIFFRAHAVWIEPVDVGPSWWSMFLMLGVTLIIFFGITQGLFFDGGPMLVISQEGVWCRRYAFIPWSDISFIEKADSTRRGGKSSRFAFGMNDGERRFNISCDTLDHSASEILGAIRTCSNGFDIQIKVRD
jgi:hypothetical protein